MEVRNFPHVSLENDKDNDQERERERGLTGDVETRGKREQ